MDPATGAVAAPIYLSTTFERDIEGTYSRGFIYSRNDNPNRKTLERGVSMLEGGEAAAAFASGTGAAMSILQALSPGDHVLAHIDAYYGTSRLIREIFVRWGLRGRFRGHERPRCGQESVAAKYKTGLGRNAFQSAAESCRSRRAR